MDGNYRRPHLRPARRFNFLIFLHSPFRRIDLDQGQLTPIGASILNY
jgi:hypothetical protein